MKENVLEVLIYLFDNYMDDEDSQWTPDRESLTEELEQAGFLDGEIEKAFTWLEGLADHREQPPAREQIHTEAAQRIYNERETGRLDAECLGFIMFLEHNGILSPAHREIVLERIMALESDEIDLDQVKWVILMVLFNLPGQEAAYAWMEDLVFDQTFGRIH